MMHQNLSARIAVMRDLVREVEQRVSSGETPPEGLENFKAAIDDIRLRLWAVLASAGERGDPVASMQRFRLRRAIDVCRTVSADLGSGWLRLDYAEVGELRRAADQLALQIEENDRRGDEKDDRSGAAHLAGGAILRAARRAAPA